MGCTNNALSFLLPFLLGMYLSRLKGSEVLFRMGGGISPLSPLCINPCQ